MKKLVEIFTIFLEGLKLVLVNPLNIVLLLFLSASTLSLLTYIVFSSFNFFELFRFFPSYNIFLLFFIIFFYYLSLFLFFYSLKFKKSKKAIGSTALSSVSVLLSSFFTIFGCICMLLPIGGLLSSTAALILFLVEFNTVLALLSLVLILISIYLNSKVIFSSCKICKN
ncbi:MAG: hypothetical protein N3D10_02585 [Candidatus Micrarchaeota archaeon]|nr:hypothetical protein [Candidatus Micrarchaeota archaeon]